MEMVDLLTILAILLGPIIAVRLTRWLDDQKERRARRLNIFRILMSTRAANLSPAHIESLNSIDLEFNKKSSGDKKVRLSWKIYLDHLGNRGISPAEWNTRRVDLLVDLLENMGNVLGYDFDKIHIKNGVYYPDAHGAIELDQSEIRKGVRDILEGKRVVPIHITNIPPQSPEIKSDN